MPSHDITHMELRRSWWVVPFLRLAAFAFGIVYRSSPQRALDIYARAAQLVARHGLRVAKEPRAVTVAKITARRNRMNEAARMVRESENFEYTMNHLSDYTP